MGFYGNITNTSNTTFQFDRIYPNRLSMDANANNDGIFIGRYVLVEYQENAAYPVVYIKNNKFYSSPNYEDASRIKFLSGTRVENPDTNNDGYLDGIYEGEFVQHYVNLNQVNGNITFDKIDFYKCIGGTGGYAVFEKATPQNKSDYITNFGIDEAHYSSKKGFKGYDSTVWTKASVESNGKLITKYVHIADLNSVVPTFDIAADAPTTEPLTPHFDADSTNVYYKLHMQTPFGFRIKETTADKSDEEAVHYITKYDKNTNTTTTTTKLVDADIFYNKDALTFKKNDTSNRVKTSGTDEIKIVPTGKSEGYSTKYSHYSKGENIGDIQELSIHLPSVGYMVSQGWDVIHGPKRDDARTDINGSLQGRLDSFTDMNVNAIPVKRADDGTLVASYINGNNNKTVGTNKILDENLSTSFDQDDAWIRTEINTANLDNKTKLSGISIHHTWHKQNDTKTTTNKNTNGVTSTNTSDKIDLYTPIVDKAGHVVGKNTETVTLPYGYKCFKTDGIVSEDEKGDLYSTNVNTNGIQETKPTKVESYTEARNTQDTLSINPANKWIQTKLVNTENDGDVLTIAHEIHSIDETVSKQGDNKTSHSNLNKEDGANNEVNLTMYDWTYDKAGHITSKRKHTYTLPFSYKNIEIANDGNASSAEPASVVGTQTADATQDNLKLTTSNKWILLDASEKDVIKIGHKLSGIEAKEYSSSDTNIANFGDSFNILKFTTDKAGHITNVQEESIKIPNIVFTNDNNGNVVTNMAYNYNVNNKTGTFTETRENIGTLSLGTHTGITTTTNGLNIISSDTISDAFNKTQTHINNLKLESTDSDSDWVADVTQTDGQVAIIRKGTNNLKLKDYSALTGVSTMELDSNDTLNNAFGKLEYRIKEEEKNREAAINALSVTDTIDNTKYVSGVSETNGKITVSRAGTDTLKLSNYSIGSNGQDITNNDTINSAFGKLQKQIKNIIGNGEIADEFNTIKEIADWLKENDSNADKIIDSIATLNSDDTTEGSVANSIKVAIEGLDSSKTADKNKYISGITITNGKITDIQQTALGSAAYKNEEYFAKADNAIQPNTKFIYGAEQKTIQELMTIVKTQAEAIDNLQNQINELKNSPQQLDNSEENV